MKHLLFKFTVSDDKLQNKILSKGFSLRRNGDLVRVQGILLNLVNQISESLNTGKKSLNKADLWEVCAEIDRDRKYIDVDEIILLLGLINNSTFPIHDDDDAALHNKLIQARHVLLSELKVKKTKIGKKSSNNSDSGITIFYDDDFEIDNEK